MWAPAFNFGLGARFGFLQVALLALFCAALVALGAWAGHSLGRAPLLVELADLRTLQAETAKLQALASARVLSDAQTRGDQLTNRLAASQAHITQLETEKHRAINRLTTGRPCFSADVVRVLNGADTATDGSVDVSAPTGSAAATGEAFASDSDVGQWVTSTQAQYEQCRLRLDALIDWHTAPAPINPNATTGHDL